MKRLCLGLAAAASPVTSVAGSPDQWTGPLGVAYTF